VLTLVRYLDRVAIDGISEVFRDHFVVLVVVRHFALSVLEEFDGAAYESLGAIRANPFAEKLLLVHVLLVRGPSRHHQAEDQKQPRRHVIRLHDALLEEWLATTGKPVLRACLPPVRRVATPEAR